MRFNPKQIAQLGGVVLLLIVSFVTAVETHNGLIVPTVNPELIETKLNELQTNRSLSEEARNRLLEQYRAILSQLKELEVFNQSVVRYRDILNSAPGQIAAINTQIEQIRAQHATDPPVHLPKNADLQEIERLLAAKIAELNTIQTQLADLPKRIEDVNRQPATARTRLNAINIELEQVNQELGQPIAGTSPDAEQQARQWLSLSRRDRLRAETQMLEQQLASFNLRLDLAKAQYELAQYQLQQVQTQRTWLDSQADRLRRIEAEQVRDETLATERALEDAHPLLRSIATANSALGENISQLARDLERVTEQQVTVEQRRTRIEQNFRDARERLEVAGLNRALGQVLIEQRAQLPSTRSLRRDRNERADRIAEASLNLIRLREERRHFQETEQQLSQLLNSQTQELPKATQQKMQAQLRELLAQQRELIHRVITLQDNHLRALAQLDDQATRLFHVVERYDTFLAERLLWVRNIAPITEQNLAPLPGALLWLVHPQHWLEIATILVAPGPLTATVPFWLLLLVVAGLVVWSRRLRQMIRHCAEPLRRVTTDRFVFTLKALALTLVLALPWPLLLYGLGWRLSTALESSVFTSAIAQALMQVSLVLYYLRAFMLICLTGGVADRHFRWRADTMSLLQRDFRRIALSLLPFAFIAVTFHHQPESSYSSTLGRLAVVVFMLLLALFMGHLTHPRRGAFKVWLADHPQSWANRLRYLWYPLIISLPMILAGLALAGFLYTAGVLLRSLLSAVWLLLGLVVVQQLLVRWLMLTRRSLMLKAALERSTSREEDRASVEEEVDLAALDEQTRSLVNSAVTIVGMLGLWMIGTEVLPALRFFEHIELWRYTTSINGQMQTLPVTLADIGFATLVITFAWVGARNLPALLEILLLRHTQVSAGSRYTLTTLTGYVITATATLLVVSSFGLSWGQVQWLVAALGVGIGFGLQEIVANFISGLIILFERPIRVGDVVTIGDTTGTVTRIQIRATTIRNWDKQELLVPNKEFITGRLLNWTLTDKLNRIAVTVGVEYGTDPKAALALMAQAAAEHPLILNDPAPLITFEGFGDNGMTLVLRFYLDSLDNRMAIINDVYQAINERFQAAGIGVARPQRALHLQTDQPIDLRLVPASREPMSDVAALCLHKETESSAPPQAT